MTVRIGINGFGRIGRSVFRAIDQDEAFADIEVVAINDLTDNATSAHLLKYDSVMGVYAKKVASDEHGIIVDDNHIKVLNHRNPADIPWGELGVDYVLESTGFFTTKETGAGTGLGLAMVYNIVKQHHGFIDVYSEEGVGTTFNTYLPVLEEKISKEEKSKKEQAIPLGNGLILVVDDEPITRDITRVILKECGYESLLAENGAEGTALFEAHKNDITAVLLDMSMPVMAGKEAFLKMKTIDPEIKVILTSGFKHNERINHLIEMGVKEFIQKPYTLEKIAKTLHRVISGQQASGQQASGQQASGQEKNNDHKIESKQYKT